MTKLVVVRHSGMRDVSGDDLQHVLPDGRVQIFEHRVDPPQRVGDAIEQGDWVGQGAWLGAEAATVHTLFTQNSADAIHYFGLVEVPHAIAFGALLGDEYPIFVHDFDRDRGRWDWPQNEQTLTVETIGVPQGPPIRAPGPVVLRVELSFSISDEAVREVVRDNSLAEVRIRRSGNKGPEICAVRSEADLDVARFAIRKALSQLREQVPNYELLHVFVAAPVSVCFALGQELKPRNAPPIQTYRYRKVPDEADYKPAIELSARMEQEVELPLTPGEQDTAQRVRKLWQVVTDEASSYAAKKQQQRAVAAEARWFELLSVARLAADANPFPALAAVINITPRDVRVDPDPVPREFGFTPEDRTWHLSDRLLLGFHRAAEGDEEQLRRLIRLFLFHEYVHVCHSITKARAQDVGMFPNCLEFLDYTADVYALFHVLDQEREERFRELEAEAAQLRFLREAVRLAIRDMWAFEQAAPIRELQVRRLRRYLNWYWRLAQLAGAVDLAQAVRLLSAPPHIEIAGLRHLVRDQRHFCKLASPPNGSHLEVGVVLENLKFMRRSDGPVINVRGLVAAFSTRDTTAIEVFFRKVYEEANDLRGALPA